MKGGKETEMEIKEIALKEIEIKENIRQYSEGTADLMKSIKDNGLLQPIGVKEISNNKYFIIWEFVYTFTIQNNKSWK